MKREEEFLPIPSLDNKYEINRQGVVRNAKTKEILTPRFLFRPGKHIQHRSINSLLQEVYGDFNTTKKRGKNIPCSCEKDGKKFYFQTIKDCAKFLSKKALYFAEGVRRELTRRTPNFHGWKINYFDEPKASDFI